MKKLYALTVPALFMLSFQNCSEVDLSRSLSVSASGITESFPTSDVLTEPETPVEELPLVEKVTQFNFAAADFTIEAPLFLGEGFIGNTVVTSDPVDSGLASIEVTIEEAGEYVVHAVVTAPSGTENSFFVDFDQLPVVTTVWHIPLSLEPALRTVAWGAPGVNPRHVFVLSEGVHTLYFRGREVGPELRSVQVNKFLGATEPEPTTLIGIDGQFSLDPDGIVLQRMNDFEACKVLNPIAVQRVSDDATLQPAFDALLSLYRGKDCPEI